MDLVGERGGECLLWKVDGETYCRECVSEFCDSFRSFAEVFDGLGSDG